MNKRIKKTFFYIKEEGLIFFLKKRLYRHIFAFFLMPYYLLLLKVKNINTKEDAIKFIFKDSNNYFASVQVESEINSLLELIVKNSPKIIMEIGTAFGGTLFLLSKVAISNATIISIDLPGGEFGAGYPWWKIPLFKAFKKKGQFIYLIRGDSHSTVVFNKIREILGNRGIDFLFIDGDHTYKGVKSDFLTYSKLVKNGGLIAFHDIIPNIQMPACQVHIFWNEIKGHYKNYEFIENFASPTPGIGVIELK